MRLPALARTTPFRLTLIFLSLFATVAAIFLAYIYIATAGEVTRQADREIGREFDSLQAVYARGGITALNQEVIQRSVGDRPFVYLLMDAHAKPVTGTLARTPVDPALKAPAETGFRITDTDPDGAVVHTQGWGRQIRLPSGELLFVGADISEGRAAVIRIVRAIEGAAVLVIPLGLVVGLVVSRNVSRSLAEVNKAVAAVEGGDLHARIPVRGVRDEYDELALRLNGMLDRLERLMGGLRHAGDAIAHDLRSPLTRLRARLEVALMEVEAGHADPRAALVQALEDSDAVLRTFSAVLAITRLEAAGRIVEPKPFDVSELAGGVAELYEVLCEEKGQDFGMELAPGLMIKGDRDFVAQALANLLDNAVKYTPGGGAVMLRARRRGSGEIEITVTDTGPGIPEEDRDRVLERFVRLEQSRSAPGSGLGLSLVAAVATAHGGRLELDEGPGMVDGKGPGLRTALVFPPA
ncbi:HAMP domain-containing sensor histidine kinase [Caulobacter sp. S45]|uniref:sensor histidine kinase n=1 Tax=Caulobacter sp. S45 TaxID=1641861 RepID=UPI00131C1AB6|nr:HAMP domain-containing sensor histidine kinase [Caulobacter sp. S45]